jgi:hypothetical protein
MLNQRNVCIGRTVTHHIHRHTRVKEMWN